MITLLGACNLSRQAMLQKAKPMTEQEDGMRQAMKQEIENTMDPSLGIVPYERLLPAYEYTRTLRRQSSHSTRTAVSNITWTERGPNNVGGRTRSIIYDRNDPGLKTVWAGGVGGGLWKTTDITAANPVWTKSNDFFDNLAITTIVQDPSNYNVIYFGTGEGFFNSDRIRGLGIWKTTDGGVSWNQLPSTNNSSFYWVQKMVIRNNGDIFACTADGVQKSDDNGATWTKVLGNGMSGATTNIAYDVEIGPDNDVYVGLDGEIFKSDHGTWLGNTGNAGTWTNITASGNYGRVEVFCAPSDSNRVYALCGSFGPVIQILKSTDAGITWDTITNPGFCDQGYDNPDFSRGQSWYDLIGAVDPADPNTLYIGGVDALKSNDAGATWNQITSWTGGGSGTCTAPNTFVHADHHAIVFKPGTSSELLWGTDGGVFMSTDSGATFSAKNSGYNVTQYYACAIHPLLNDYFLAGAQDNGTQKYTQPGMNATTAAAGGDGMFCHIDQNDGMVQLTSYYNNYYNVSNDGGNTFNFMGGDGSGRFVNPHDYDHTNKILYGGYKPGFYEIYTDVGGANTESTRDISSVVDSLRIATALKVDPSSPSTVWMAFRNTNMSPVLVRVDQASSASPIVTNLSTGLPTNNGATISCIEVEPTNSDHLLVTLTNYGITSIFESVNGGNSWDPVEGNLPDMPVRWAMFHPDSSDMAFIATELGVWSTTDLDGVNTNWTPTNSNFANVRVDMLQYRAADHLLAAATHGRGLFTARIPHPTALNFDAVSKVVEETPEVANGCRPYRDITINAMASYPPTSTVSVNIKVAAGASATDSLDFEYTTNGSFGSPSHQIDFTPSVISVPVTVRIYDDVIPEQTPENFTLTFDVLTGTAAQGMHNECTFTIHDNDDDPDQARKVFLAEDFESGMNPPAGWILLGTDINQWGNQNFSCPSTINNFTMQIYNTATNSCGYDNTSGSDAMAYRMVDGTGFTKLKVSFDWTGEGEPGYDFGELMYSIDTSTPNWIPVPGVSYFVNSNVVSNESVLLPDTLSGTHFLLGWHWQNDYSVGGTAWAIDNVNISGLGDREIETTLASDQAYLGPHGECYYYSADGDLVCRIENLGSFDYGCTTVSIDRAGNGAQFLTGETDTLKKVFDKTIFIKPDSNTSNGNYRVTMYITTDELNGFETQGRSWAAQGKIFRTSDSVKNASTYTPRDTSLNHTQNVYLNGAAVSGEFAAALAAYGIGSPGKSKVAVSVPSYQHDGISIYPNPAGDRVWIKTREELHLEVFNSIGQQIDRWEINGNREFSISSWSPGVYFLHLPESGKTFSLIKK